MYPNQLNRGLKIFRRKCRRRFREFNFTKAIESAIFPHELNKVLEYFESNGLIIFKLDFINEKHGVKLTPLGRLFLRKGGFKNANALKLLEYLPPETPIPEMYRKKKKTTETPQTILPKVAPITEPPKKEAGCWTIILIVLGAILIIFCLGMAIDKKDNPFRTLVFSVIIVVYLIALTQGSKRRY